MAAEHRRLLLGAQHDRTVGVVLLDCHVEFGLCAGDGIAGVLQLFAANEVRGAQRDAAVQVSLRGRGRFLTSIFACSRLLLIICWRV